MNFDAAVRDTTTGFAAAFDGSSTCLMAFGGIAGGLEILPFEFFRLAGELPVAKVFLRDHEQAWYQCGVRGLGDDIPAVAEALGKMVADNGIQRLVTFGNSAGGFAAILFGALLGASEVHAFAPQTLMTRSFRLLHRDFRWRNEVSAMYRKLPASAHLDVLPAMNGLPVHVYYSADDRRDKVHAQRLGGAPGVTLHRLEGGGHGVIRDMRDSGQLHHIIRSSLLLADR